jgi:hypothetical protein
MESPSNAPALSDPKLPVKIKLSALWSTSFVKATPRANHCRNGECFRLVKLDLLHLDGVREYV